MPPTVPIAGLEGTPLLGFLRQSIEIKIHLFYVLMADYKTNYVALVNKTPDSTESAPPPGDM